jgi:hypothetical protein
MSDWVDVKVMQAMSQHTVAATGAIFSFAILKRIEEYLISDEWLQIFLHAVEQFVLVGLALYLVGRLCWHLLNVGKHSR